MSRQPQSSRQQGCINIAGTLLAAALIAAAVYWLSHQGEPALPRTNAEWQRYCADYGGWAPETHHDLECQTWRESRLHP